MPLKERKNLSKSIHLFCTTAFMFSACKNIYFFFSTYSEIKTFSLLQGPYYFYIIYYFIMGNLPGSSFICHIYFK